MQQFRRVARPSSEVLMPRLPLLFVLMGCTNLAFAEVVESTRQELSVGAGPTLIVEDDGGSVEIHPGPEGKLQVEARRRAPTKAEALALPVTVQLDGNTVTVRYHDPNHAPGRSVAFVIQAPPATRLQLSTAGGSISTDKMGAQTLHSGGGSISASEVDGAVEARTGGGSIQVSGRLRGTCKLNTGGGSVQVRVPGDSRLKVDGTTGGGSAHNDFGLPVSGMGSRRFSGTLGDGKDGSLEVRTGGGSIELSRL
jgi:hypothetical protein